MRLQLLRISGGFKDKASPSLQNFEPSAQKHAKFSCFSAAFKIAYFVLVFIALALFGGFWYAQFRDFAGK